MKQPHRWKLWLPALWLAFGCTPEQQNDATLFESISPDHSGVHFSNTLREDADFNIIEYLYYYNGGGVAIGDINNDGLPDLYFSGNQVPNKLYLNKGNFEFEDITENAGVGGKGNWKTGVNMVDVNADGYLDIFVCGVGNYKKFDGYNQLYINNGDLTFTDRTEAYGLSFQGFSTHSAFFDYDLDGDLDLYLLNHSVHTQRSYGMVSLREKRDSLAGDRMYKNLLAESGKTFFDDVTSTSGIYSSALGYGLGIGISDLNRDRYPDIYVSNDFIENDYLYINNHDGTFREQVGESMGHTSRFSMGNDLADINNDGWVDIITLDMLPKDEAVIKTSAAEDSYEVYNFKLKYGYHKQVSRNTVQLNYGTVNSGEPLFGDIAAVSGLEATDWSWAPLMVDFNGDGWRDIFISNGIVRRPNDMDYISFISSDSVQRLEDVLPWIAKMPEGKVSNFVFRNRGDLTFEDKTVDWGLSLPGFSNGAAYGDLDNDGDPDLVVNRINETPLIYRNNSDPDRFLKVIVHGDTSAGNAYAIGATITATQGDRTQKQEIFPARGWCSSSDYAFSFGVDQSSKDPVTVKVIWPDGASASKVAPDKAVHFFYGEANVFDTLRVATANPLLQRTVGPGYRHVEDDFNAFSKESLMPHMLSTEGPALAVGDVNGDDLADVFIGGAKNQESALFFQRPNGEFIRQQVPDFRKHVLCEDVSASFFDADGDDDMDLVVVSAGQEAYDNNALIEPRFYVNTNGRLRYAPGAFNGIYLHASCVKPNDYDNDGDIDIFIGAAVMPMLYGMSPVSYLLVNDGSGKFSSDADWVGASQFENPTRVRPGMVKDAVWAHVNDDKLIDLVLVGEWMPVTILLQQPNHQFRNVTREMGLQNKRGWWNAVVAHDFDGDGDADLVAGNLGWNSRLKASTDKPLQMYLGDFDSNGGSDHILVYYNGDHSYPFASRDALVKQLPGLKKKFLSYRDYSNVKLEDIVTPDQKGNSAIMTVDDFSSLYIENKGNSFAPVELPLEAQLFPIFAIAVDDINNDSIPDLLITGNLSATQPDLGPYDCGLGLVLKGNGDGTFSPLTPARSGFVVQGEGRGIAVIRNAEGEKQYLVARNNDTIQSFKNQKHE